MPLPLIGTGRTLLGGQAYADKVLALRPIAYWPQWEPSGGVAFDISGNARNGAYTGVDLGRPGIGDGRTAPYYDGANDYVNIYSISLNAAFTGAECTVAIWNRVSAAGVWTDGTFRTSIILYVDVNNYIILRKPNAANSYNVLRLGGGVTSAVTPAITTTDWFHIAITISQSAGANGQMKAYLNGQQTGATQVALGAWAGNLNALLCSIGAQNQAPASVWSGWLGHCGIFNRALTGGEIETLYRR